jgi:cephalosporin hydroxylase
MNLEKKYVELCSTPSDINEHLPTLCRYASECDHVTEAGVRYVVSTFGLMMGKPRNLVSIDIVHPNDMTGGENDVIKGKDEFVLAERFAKENGVDFKFVLGSTLDLDLEPTDLLFLDTFHKYEQLSKELERHHGSVGKYILLHDTNTFAYRDEGEEMSMNIERNNIKKGLWLAMKEFLENHPEWEIHEQFFNNNGLTILKKKNKS